LEAAFTRELSLYIYFFLGARIQVEFRKFIIAQLGVGAKMSFETARGARSLQLSCWAIASKEAEAKAYCYCVRRSTIFARDFFYRYLIKTSKFFRPEVCAEVYDIFK